MSNVTSSSAKSLKFYKDGEQITDMKNLITGETGVSTVTAALYEPVMLYVGPTNQVTLDVSDLEFVKNSFAGSISVRNDSLPEDEKVVIKVEAYNNEGAIREYQKVNTQIPVGGITDFEISMSLASDVTYVNVSVMDAEELLTSTEVLYR